MMGSSSMAISKLIADGLARGFGQSDRALLNDGGQFARRADEAANLNPQSLTVDDVNGEQRAAVNLMVEPHISDAIEKHFAAYRCVKHSNSPLSLPNPFFFSDSAASSPADTAVALPPSPDAPGNVSATASHLDATTAAWVFGCVASELRRAVRDINSQIQFRSETAS
jgi:hypothetical protein